MASVDGKGSWMNCAAEIEKNTLKRIMAVLFALADLADRAAGRSWPVRRLVLSILGFAEQAAHEFVTGSADTTNLDLSLPASAAPAPRRGGPVDAMQLALSFPMLALAVHAMLASRSRGRSARDAGHLVAGAQAADRTGPRSPHLSQERQAAALPGPAYRKWPDTS